MKGKKHKPEQIIRKLREADAMLSADSTSAADTCTACASTTLVCTQPYPPFARR